MKDLKKEIETRLEIKKILNEGDGKERMYAVEMLQELYRKVRLQERKRIVEEVKIYLAKEMGYENKYSEILELLSKLSKTKN